MKTKIKIPLLILGLSIAFLSACDGGSEDVNLTENEVISLPAEEISEGEEKHTGHITSLPPVSIPGGYISSSEEIIPSIGAPTEISSEPLIEPTVEPSEEFPIPPAIIDPVPVCEHEMVYYDYYSGNCLQNGNIEYYHCLECNSFYLDKYGTQEISIEDTIIYARGYHSYSDYYVSELPTFEKEGKIQKDCSECDSTVVQFLPVLDFNENYESSNYYINGLVKPTCEEDGIIICTYIYDYYDGFGNLTEVDWAEDVCVSEEESEFYSEEESYDIATDDVEYTDALAVCTEPVPLNEIDFEVILPATGHDYRIVPTANDDVYYPAVPENDLEDDNVFNDDLKEIEVIDRHDVYYECRNCNASYIYSPCSEFGHLYAEEYSFDSTGHWYQNYCHPLEIEIIPHNFEEVVIEPTCTDFGITKKVCVDCKYEENVEGSLKDAFGHDYGQWHVDIEAECYLNGSKHAECSRCGFVVTETIEGLVHNYIEVITSQTCEEKGYSTFTCEHCGAYYIDSYTEALGHIYGKWIVKKSPTISNVGVLVKVCEHDKNHYIEQEIPILNDLNYQYNVIKQPTVTEKGIAIYRIVVDGQILIFQVSLEELEEE